MAPEDERIALFLDYENLAIGARDGLGVSPFDFGPVADALAERGRVVTRRAYADWSSFDEDRRLLARAQVELIEIPQRIGGSRKNAADIKMAVDAIELAYEREFVTTFAIGTGDSDFTPLMHKLREMDKRVIGIGVQSSTSKLLPRRVRRVPVLRPAARGRGAPRPAEVLATTAGRGDPRHPGRRTGARRGPGAGGGSRPEETTPAGGSDTDITAVVTSTLAGLARAADGAVRASTAQARDPAQGPHVRRGRPGLPRLRRAAAQPRGSRASLALTPGNARRRPRGGVPRGHVGRGRGVRAVRHHRARPRGGGRRPAPALGSEGPDAQARPRTSARSATGSTASCPSPAPRGPATS